MSDPNAELLPAVAPEAETAPVAEVSPASEEAAEPAESAAPESELADAPEEVAAEAVAEPETVLPDAVQPAVTEPEMVTEAPVAPEPVPAALPVPEPIPEPIEEGPSFGEIFAEFEHTHQRRSEDDRRQIRGTVLKADDEFVYVDIGYKSEGTLPLTAFPAGKLPEQGATVLVSVKGRSQDGYYELSLFRTAVPKDWTGLEAAFAEKATIVGTVTAVVKGGLHVDVGVRAFLPASRSGAREAGELERIWVVNPAHEIADGLPAHFDIPNEEMYGELFDIPTPEELVLISWFEGGNVFRSGCTWTRGKGKVAYFRPGHEMFPTYFHPEVRRVIANAVKWAALRSSSPFSLGAPNPVVPLSPIATRHVVDESIHR